MAFAIVLAIPVVAFVSVMAIFVVWAPADEDTLSSRCADATPVAEVEPSDAGQVIVVSGEVTGIRAGEEGLTLEISGPGTERSLAVAIRQGNLENWTMPPADQYGGRSIATAGVLQLSGGRLELEARFPGDIAICS